MSNSRIPGSQGRSGPWAPNSSRTPGILGINDGADPNFEGMLGDSPGSLGYNDHADVLMCHRAQAEDVPTPPWNHKITLDQLSQVVGATAAAGALDQVNRAMELGHVDTPARQAAFLAQIAQETAGLRKLDEGGSDAYFTKMYDPGTSAGDIVGNTIEGDGKRFKGRGLVQLTGRENYTRAWIYLDLATKKDAKNEDLFRNLDPIDPSLAAKPEYSSKIAAWYWDVYKKVNATADQLETSAHEKATFIKVTKKINGGTNGLDQRIEYYKLAKKALGITWGQIHWAPPKPKLKKKATKPPKGPKKPAAKKATPGPVKPPSGSGVQNVS
jgi:predicted chitinase